ncbi:MAG: nitroreductase [Bdellovibrionales bacterium]|nr:nitroreductase [Bdellovibrionales bacterium]
MTKVDIEEIIKTRRTIHEYLENQKVEQHVVDTALDLGLWAPNHKMTFPWVFYDMGPVTRQKMISLALELNQKKMGLEFTEAKRQNLQKKLNSMSHMIGLGIKKSEDLVQAREDYASMACAIQNISLYLWSKGIGSKWSTGRFTHHEQTYEILDINPHEVELVGALFIGYPPSIPRSTPRPKLQDVAIKYI